MLERNQSLLPTPPRDRLLRVLCIGFDEASLDELDQLLRTLKVETVGRFCVALRRISPATYVGKGKLEEIQGEVEKGETDLIVIDKDLSPNQLRNLEKALGKPTIDRAGVIIEIFSAHARTKEAKTQVELARLQYLLPRLVHFWSHFERQRGGIGMKGMGEKQIEVDRRLLKKRMSLLRERLQSIEKERNVQRAGRDTVLKVAIIGYTNAGKSTLLNAMTRSAVLAENKLFATLDATVRALSPDSHPPIVAIDTVGFISNIPTALIASFRSTLEELHQADLLLHVVDASSPQAREQMMTTEDILKEMELENKPRITVLNKVDQIKGDRVNLARLISPGALRVSAYNGEDVQKLREHILDHFRKQLETIEVMIPYAESKLEAQLHALGSIEAKHYYEKGTFYKLKMDKGWAQKLNLQRYRL